MNRTLPKLEDVIVRARKAAGCKNDVELSRQLGLSKNAVSQWQRGMSHPSPGVALQLAELAGIDGHVFILQCEAWRAAAASKPALYKAYMDIIGQVIRPAACVILFATVAKMTMGTNIAHAALTIPQDRILCDKRPSFLRLFAVAFV